MLTSFRSRLIALFAAAGALFVAIGVEVDRSARLFRDDAERVTETIVRTEHIRSVVSALHAAESSQRAFLLTGHDRDLGDYLSTRCAARRRACTSVFAAPIAMRELGKLVDRRLAILADVFDVRRRDGLDAAKALVATGRGHDARAPSKRPPTR
jgi:CHASE3 domain sensor protein